MHYSFQNPPEADAVPAQVPRGRRPLSRVHPGGLRPPLRRRRKLQRQAQGPRREPAPPHRGKLPGGEAGAAGAHYIAGSHKVIHGLIAVSKALI